MAISTRPRWGASSIPSHFIRCARRTTPSNCRRRRNNLYREEYMRRLTIATVLGASLAIFATSANAAPWHSYVSHKLGFSFEAPGDVKVSMGTYRGSVAGPRETIVFRSVDNN